MVERKTCFTPDKLTREFVVTNREQFNAGGLEDKYLLHATDGTSYIERKYSTEYEQTWRALRSAGLPIIEETLFNPIENYVLVRDLKQDGSEIYGRSWDLSFRYPDFYPFHRRQQAIDQLFLTATNDQHLPHIVGQVKRNVNIANANGFRLADDDPFDLIVRPDGTNDIVFIDIRNTLVDVPVTRGERIDRALKNDELAERFLAILQRIRGHIQAPAS